MSEGNKMFPILLITIAVVVSITQAQPEANFQCKTQDATCRSITEYTNPNTTTLEQIQTLFGIKHYLDFLGVNNLPTNTKNSYKLTPNRVIKVPFQCKCDNGTGKSNHVPQYKIKPGDTLDVIARTRFASLVKYQQIQTANKIVDADNITAGDTLWIPLPCSCDKVDGNSVMHYAHIVQSGSSIESIAQQFGATQQSLQTINGIKDPKSLEAGQILDVPLPVCNSSVKSDSLDFPLLVPNGTYFYTANECVKCKCDSTNNFLLQCDPSNQKPINKWSVCPSTRCSGSVLIGNTTSTDSCSRTVCDYTGYTSSNISTALVTQNTCAAVAPDGGGGNSGSGASRSILNKLLVLIQFLLFFVYLL
ncbi:hypothetical protein P8452_38851 [Trifolium repens]|nr:hypothetical protein P8452_38851 [Trifolium repens]